MLEAVSQISDALPRRDIQSLGMELLLGKAHRTNQFPALTKSETYQRVYRSKAQELVH